MATKASKVLLMFWPAIMLTAWGVGVLRSDECYLFQHSPACGCTNQSSCNCHEGTCCCPVITCNQWATLVPVVGGGSKLGEIVLTPCHTVCECSVPQTDRGCDPNGNPCVVWKCRESNEKFLKANPGGPCPHPGPGPRVR
jgi:hypothetical protein